MSAMRGKHVDQSTRLEISLPSALLPDLYSETAICMKDCPDKQARISRFVAECVESALAERRLRRAMEL